jgi:hypothetical protein
MSASRASAGAAANSGGMLVARESDITNAATALHRRTTSAVKLSV